MNTGTLKITAPTDREFVLARVFDAPRRLVFDAFTKLELLKRLFSPRGWSLDVASCWAAPKGRLLGMRGSYREIVPPERSVHMQSFDDYPGPSRG